MKSINNYRGGISKEFDTGKLNCCSDGCNKLDVFDWLKDIPQGLNPKNLVEIRFKNTRKGFYYNINGINLEKGDLVAVEASPGHDIGVVSLTGELVLLQMKRYNVPVELEHKKIYRKAKPTDIEKWENAISLEDRVMLEARQIAEELGLSMKIGDVEYQGDGTKAIFYYIADERVDFRELIKVLADRFKIRIEMRQIGARQEAGRIGGIGSCGRELCCATYMSNFVSVTTGSARYQELSLNPQKLAGQCGKLKCCLNYELDAYLDKLKDFPQTNVALETVEGTAYHQKTDIFKGIMWYSFDPHSSLNMIAVQVERVKEIQMQNKKGKKVLKLVGKADTLQDKMPDYENAVGQESLTRFDKTEKTKKKKRRKPKQHSSDGRRKRQKPNK